MHVNDLANYPLLNMQSPILHPEWLEGSSYVSMRPTMWCELQCDQLSRNAPRLVLLATTGGPDHFTKNSTCVQEHVVLLQHALTPRIPQDKLKASAPN